LAIAANVLCEINSRGGNVRESLSSLTAYLKALELLGREEPLELLEQAYRIAAAPPTSPSDMQGD